MSLYNDLMLRNTAVKEVIFPVFKMSISNAESVLITVFFPLPHLSYLRLACDLNESTVTNVCYFFLQCTLLQTLK